eukprot:6739605-Alexandrium_andersonii.AAC.1
MVLQRTTTIMSANCNMHTHAHTLKETATATIMRDMCRKTAATVMPRTVTCRRSMDSTVSK